jgi:hypothetical protein
MHEHVKRIRELLKDATPKAKPRPVETEEQRRRAFEYYEFNVGLPVVESTPRARALRDIARISTWYGWGAEVTRALDAEGVTAAGELSDAAVEALLVRMLHLEDAAQMGCGAPDAPPA